MDFEPNRSYLDPLGVKRWDLAGKLEILFESDWDAERKQEDLFVRRMKELQGTKELMLAADHLQTWWCYLHHAFEETLQRDVYLADPQVVYNWWMSVDVQHQDKLRRSICRQCRGKSLVLVPCFSMEPAHWTLLAVDAQTKTCRIPSLHGPGYYY